MEFVFWLADNFFGTPAILIGLIVLIGLLLQKKRANQVITGTFKAIIGFLIITAGAGIITGSLEVFEPLWAEVFGLDYASISNYMGQETFNAEFGSVVTLSMTFGFLINVLLARFTPLKYIYLTGHMMFWTSTIFAGIIVHASGGGANMLGMVAFLSIVLGVYWTVQPAIVQPFMRKIMGNNEVALGHTSASVGLLSALAGKLVGKNSQNTEDVKLPKGLEFLRDSNVITALTMALLFVTGAIIISLRNSPGSEELEAMAGGQSFIVYALIQSFTFAAGIAVVLTGVRMFIGEIVPAFRGIATKIVPGAKPALDNPIVFPSAPNAVIVGFIGAFFGALVWLAVLGNTVSYIFVPTMIVLFFHGATAGVFGNITGGIRGAFMGGLITATVVAWGQFVMVRMLLPTTVPDTAMWAADSDMFILGPIVYWLAHLFFG